MEIKSLYLIGRSFPEPLEICLQREMSQFPDVLMFVSHEQVRKLHRE